MRSRTTARQPFPSPGVGRQAVPPYLQTPLFVPVSCTSQSLSLAVSHEATCHSHRAGSSLRKVGSWAVAFLESCGCAPFRITTSIGRPPWFLTSAAVPRLDLGLGDVAQLLVGHHGLAGGDHVDRLAAAPARLRTKGQIGEG